MRRDGEGARRGEIQIIQSTIESPAMPERIKSYRDLRVYQLAMEAAMEIFELTKSFPVEEKYSMTDQMRKSSRSVCTNIAEGWRKRRYKAAFIAKFSDSEGEAAETQVWLEFAMRCKYISNEVFERLDDKYDHIIGQLVKMIDNADDWLIR
jgi:four helix bundle protein